MKIHGQIKTRLRFISAYLGQTSFGSDSKSSLSKKRHDNLYIPNYKYQVLRYFRTCPDRWKGQCHMIVSIFCAENMLSGPFMKRQSSKFTCLRPPTDYVFILTSLGSILTIFKNQWFYEPLKVKRKSYRIKETSLCECAWHCISTAHTKVAEIRGNSPRVTGFNIVPLLLYCTDSTGKSGWQHNLTEQRERER